MGIQKFEDIHGWQEARKLTQLIYSQTGKGIFRCDFGLRDQIQRASVSIMANIAEGFDCDSKAEFARFLSYARRAAVEVQSLLYVALDAGYISQEVFSDGYEKARITKSMVGALKSSLRR